MYNSLFQKSISHKFFENDNLQQTCALQIFTFFLKHALIFGTKFHCSRLRILVVLKKMDTTIGKSNF